MIALLGLVLTAAGVLIAIEPSRASLEAFQDLRRRRVKYYFGRPSSSRGRYYKPSQQ